MTLLKSRNKAAKIARLLELHLGVPYQKKKRTDSLDMLIGTVLSQNTNDRNSHRAYIELRRRFPTWKKVAEAPVRAIASAIRVGGMKNQKSGRIKELLRVIHKRNGVYNLRGIEKLEDASAIAALTFLHGVGVKTAACVLLFSLRRDVFPVDTHVHRICNRLGLVRTKSPEKTFELMRGLFPSGKGYSFHTNLIRFGRSVCLAQRPRCYECPIYIHCEYADKSKLKLLPSRSSTRENPNFMLLDEI